MCKQRLTLISISLSVLSGCYSNDHSRFEFVNESSTPVWVNELSEFDFDPAPGNLIADAHAELVLPEQYPPMSTTITWWKGKDRNDKKSDVFKTELIIPTKQKYMRYPVLVFSLSEELEWRSFWRED